MRWSGLLLLVIGCSDATSNPELEANDGAAELFGGEEGDAGGRGRVSLSPGREGTLLRLPDGAQDAGLAEQLDGGTSSTDDAGDATAAPISPKDAGAEASKDAGPPPPRTTCDVGSPLEGGVPRDCADICPSSGCLPIVARYVVVGTEPHKGGYYRVTPFMGHHRAQDGVYETLVSHEGTVDGTARVALFEDPDLVAVLTSGDGLVVGVQISTLAGGDPSGDRSYRADPMPAAPPAGRERYYARSIVWGDGAQQLESLWTVHASAD